MKNVKLTFAIVCAMITMGSVASAQTPVPGTGPGVHRMHGERHPEIRAAMRALQRSRADLNRANTDFSGHRVAAIKYIDQALSELQAALASDRN